jgi:hypothetical protein
LLSIIPLIVKVAEGVPQGKPQVAWVPGGAGIKTLIGCHTFRQPELPRTSRRGRQGFTTGATTNISVGEVEQIGI